jgi:ubiquinone/menaquinone biosynthesis C-methylase UbiE
MARPEADRYYGDAVTSYEASRRKQRTWRREHSALKKILSGMPSGQRVLDVPVGTGRFFALYKRHGFDVVGVDISHEMVDASRQHAADVELDAALATGSILDLAYPDDEFDLSVSVRMMQWLSPEDTHTAIGELARVTNGTVILTAHHRLFPWPSPTAIRTRREEQAKRRRKRRHGRQVMTLHGRKHLMRSFAEHGLHIERRVELVTKPGLYTYSMWVLRTFGGF